MSTISLGESLPQRQPRSLFYVPRLFLGARRAMSLFTSVMLTRDGVDAILSLEHRGMAAVIYMGRRIRT